MATGRWFDRDLRPDIAVAPAAGGSTGCGGAILFLCSLIAACSPPFVSDTDEDTARAAPIDARPPADAGADTGGRSGTGAAGAVPEALEGALGVLEILDAAGEVSASCTVAALGPDLALTSSECAADCTTLRAVFPSRVAPGKALSSRCASIEIKESTEGAGFAVLRLSADGAGEALPEIKANLDGAAGKGTVEARLVTAARDARKGVAAAATSPCSLRYAASASAYTSHSCPLAGAWKGGLMVSAASGAVLGIFDRSVSGSRLVTTSKAILER